MTRSHPRQTQILADLRRYERQLEESGHAQELMRMRSLAARPEDVLKRTHFAPGHFTASGFVLSPDQGSLLLILHKKLKLWLQPGGHIEPTDESWQAAVLREVNEETGACDLHVLHELIDIDIHEIPAISLEPAHLHFDLRTLFLASNIEVQASDEVTSARWFSLEEVIQSSGGILVDGVGTDESVRRVARAALLLERVNR